MENRRQLEGRNRGASLIQVMISIVFVLTMGSIVLEMTWTNIRMREVELSGKKNFYSAEEVVDELTSGLRDKAAVAMQEAYTEILTDYSAIMAKGGNAQEEFAKAYLDRLTAVFQDTSRGESVLNDAVDTAKTVAVGGYYDKTLLNDLIKDETVRGKPYDVDDVELMTGDGEAIFLKDYETEDFTLKAVKIDYKDERGYETSISTDMVFHTPKLNFNSSYRTTTDYMKYGLVADKGIVIDGAGITIDGNIYAGAEGIKNVAQPGDTATIRGSNIVTRGDILAENGTVMNVGDGTGRIWAENAGTAGKGSVLNLNGNCYIADDLTLDGTESKVKLQGNYYGYNFQKEYDTDAPMETNADFSSAIMINGEKSRLDLSELNQLFLAGRTYISRGGDASVNSDIPLGESLSVRTNQLAYSVPEEFLDTDSEPVTFRDTGLTEYSSRIKVSETEMEGYLDGTAPIAVYYYRDGNVPKKRYYLNFASEQSANDFFKAYWEANKDQMSSYADNYADAIIIDENTLCTLKGYILKKDETGLFTQIPVTIAPEDLQGWQKDGFYWKYANDRATTYKSLQMYLEDSHEGITSDQVRFYDDSGKIDKTVDSLVNHLLAVGDIQTDHPRTGLNDKSEADFDIDGTVYHAVVVNRDFYQVPTGYQGIVIATGDVQIRGTFRGMVIAGGTVTFLTNATVTSDELLVSKLFEADGKRRGADGNPDPVFVKYFKDNEKALDSVIGTVKIDDYLSYENWTKNES